MRFSAKPCCAGFLRLLVLLSLVVFTTSSANASLDVAVASNFATTARLLVDEYSRENDVEVRLIVGSTAKHATQIEYGLDVDLYLAADQIRPESLEHRGIAVEGSVFNYAKGRIALWSRDSLLVDSQGLVLANGTFEHLAIANPKLAPYGEAALQALRALSLKVDASGRLDNADKAIKTPGNAGVNGSEKPKLVLGDSVAQVYQFVASGNSELGFLAYSQILQLAPGVGSMWLVPSDLHQPITQAGVIIKDSDAVRHFVAYMQSESALVLIEKQGYLRP